jgi:hypothetical protein
MRRLVLAVLILLCTASLADAGFRCRRTRSTAPPAKQLVKSRYRLYQSEHSIGRLVLHSAAGLLSQAGDSQLKEALLQKLKDRAVWLPDGEFELSDVQGARDLLAQVRQLAGKLEGVDIKIDGEAAELSPEVLLEVFRKISGWITDKRTEGSVEYSYTFPYSLGEGRSVLRVRRWVRIENGRVETSVDAWGPIMTRVDWPAVRTTVGHAGARVTAVENDRGTLIKTVGTGTVTQTYGARCRLLRRISASKGPAMTLGFMSAEIDGLLAKYAARAHEAHRQGEGSRVAGLPFLQALRLLSR